MKNILLVFISALVGSSLAKLDCVTYTVQQGDYAHKIAQDICVTDYSIFKSWNHHIRDFGRLEKGDQVCCSKPGTGYSVCDRQGVGREEYGRGDVPPGLIGLRKRTVAKDCTRG